MLLYTIVRVDAYTSTRSTYSLQPSLVNWQAAVSVVVLTSAYWSASAFAELAGTCSFNCSDLLITLARKRPACN